MVVGAAKRTFTFRPAVTSVAARAAESVCFEIAEGHHGRAHEPPTRDCPMRAWNASSGLRVPHDPHAPESLGRTTENVPYANSAKSEAARHDRPGLWTSDDVEAARCQANQTARPWGWLGPTPEEVFEKRVPISDAERRMFLASYEAYATSERQARGFDPHAELDHYQHASIDRVAIVRALVEHGYLQFRRRRVTPPFVRKRVLKIA